MAELPKNLIILGAGATAAVAPQGRQFPTAGNFFDTCNTDWVSGRQVYPHLSATYDIVRALRTDNRVTLTDVWLFLDTVNKYYNATVLGDDYNRRLLQTRYEQHARGDGELPNYLSYNYLNEHFRSLASEMRPLPSKAGKSIYSLYSKSDPVNYFLVIAGWELKHLLFRAYGPDNQTNGELYAKLLEAITEMGLAFSVLNFNYDVYFEKASHAKRLGVRVWDGKRQLSEGTVAVCKPHGGWNVQHVTLSRSGIDSARPLPEAHETIRDSDFDLTCDREERPAMIPYFCGPDEITKEHECLVPEVCQYFLSQQDIMKKMLRDAENIVSIGYSFSKHDLHVRAAVEVLGKQNRHESRRLLCILKGEDTDTEYAETKNGIVGLWERSSCSPEFYDKGFDAESIAKIREFFGKGT